MNTRLICLVGATGTGKTALALELAQRLNGVVINADSRQVYADFPIITAQPSAKEQRVCPHVLYGYLPTTASCSAGIWAANALTAVHTHQAQGGFPLLTGGTGLYIRALLDGMVEIPAIPYDVAAQLEAEYTAVGGCVLHKRLQAVDPAYAARIHHNDRQRLTRALGVYAVTGKTFTWWHAQTPPPPALHVLRMGLDLPLAELEPRLAARIDAMLDAGAIAEASRAMLICSDANAPGWSGIGCIELHQYLTGTLSLDATRALWIKNTRAYAKRQRTWFKADARIQWFRPETIDNAVEHALQWIEQHRPHPHAS